VLAGVVRYRDAPAGVLVFRGPAPPSGSGAGPLRAFVSDPATCAVLLAEPA
jgi:hypothetical protein